MSLTKLIQLDLMNVSIEGVINTYVGKQKAMVVIAKHTRISQDNDQRWTVYAFVQYGNFWRRIDNRDTNPVRVNVFDKIWLRSCAELRIYNWRADRKSVGWDSKERGDEYTLREFCQLAKLRID